MSEFNAKVAVSNLQTVVNELHKQNLRKISLMANKNGEWFCEGHGKPGDERWAENGYFVTTEQMEIILYALTTRHKNGSASAMACDRALEAMERVK